MHFLLYIWQIIFIQFLQIKPLGSQQKEILKQKNNVPNNTGPLKKKTP